MLTTAARARVTLLDHTADLGIEVRAESLDRLFEAAALGIVDVIVDATTVEVKQSRTLRLTATDREILLLKLLREIVYVYDTERWLPARVEVHLEDERALVAELGGEQLDPGRHEVKTEVKAVTYHALEVLASGAGGFRARVVLDL